MQLYLGKKNLETQSQVACNQIKQIRKQNILIDSVILVIILHV
jgi:mRNA-degrading endonuclease toxin of MazEF toxin-antitoxin module